MRRNRIRLAIAGCVLVAGCVTPGPTIPPGTYYSPSGEEHIQVGESRIVFHIRTNEERPDIFYTRDYEIRVSQGGRIHPVPATSVDAAFGTGRYFWHWNGETIVRSDPHSGRTLVFSRDHAPAADPSPVPPDAS